MMSPAMLSLTAEDIRSTGLSNRCGGLDGILFLGLFLTMIQEVLDANPKEERELAICLRERDYSYFGIQRWLSKPPPSLTKLPIGMDVSSRCLTFEGEIPSLYVMTVRLNGGTHPPSEMSSGFLALLDFVARTTGSGLGILVAGDFGIGPVGFGATDLRTGLRTRYDVRKVPASAPGPALQGFYWVERLASGRGPGIPA